MKRPLIKRLTHSPVWIILGVGLLVAAGLLLVLAFLNPGAESAAPASTAAESTTAATASTVAATTAPTAAATTAEPDTSTTEQSSTADEGEPLAASVNGYTITQSYLSQTVRLNKVLGELSGASTLGEKETLERLIRSQLILQGVTTIDEPTEEDVEGFISALEQNWGISDETMVQKLEAEDLDRGFLKETIDRLLTVQAGVESLQEEGHNVSEWLKEQEQDAEIMVFEDLAEAEASPTEEPEVPDVASDFTLDQAGGGSLTLNDQLKEGPVVLVFFERCG
jgi:hypothetical protein